MVCQRTTANVPTKRAISVSPPAGSEHFRCFLASDPLEFGRLHWMPPAPADDDAFGHDLAVADQVLAYDVFVVELAFLDRQQRGVADAARLEAAEFRTPQRHRRIHRRGGDDVRE